MNIESVSNFFYPLSELRDNTSPSAYKLSVDLAEEYAKYRLDEFIKDHFPEGQYDGQTKERFIQNISQHYEMLTQEKINQIKSWLRD